MYLSVRSKKFWKVSIDSYVLLRSYVSDSIDYSVLSPLLWFYKKLFYMKYSRLKIKLSKSYQPGRAMSTVGSQSGKPKRS